MPPKYTFLLPAFKAKYLREAIQSILAQTYTDFKLLISDDCSPEDLKSIVDEYLDDPRVSYRRNKENLGSKSLVSHWNLLVDMCETEYFILASDDDVYEANFLEEMDRLAVEYPQVDLLRARVRRINGEGETTKTELPRDKYVKQLQFIRDYFIPQYIQCVANYIIRTKIHGCRCSFCDYPLAWHSDDMSTMKFAKDGIACSSEVLFSFRVSEENITGKKDRETSRKKFIANSLWERDLSNIIDSYNDIHTLEDENLKLEINHYLQRRMIDVLISQSYILSFKEMISYLKNYNHYFVSDYDRYRYIRTWITQR